MNEQLAVIFDVDGVLVDSYDAHFRSWQLLWSEHGQEMSEREFAQTFGRTTREIIRQLSENAELSDEQVAGMDDRKEQHYRDVIARQFPEMDGAAALVRVLYDAGFAVAVGSSGPPENVELVVQRLGVADLLGATITGCDVTRGKPDPQVFLLAAERLERSPRCCAVVEDAPAGIAAAKAAGMASIGLASTGRTVAELREADLVVRSLDELSPLRIQQLISGRTEGTGACCG